MICGICANPEGNTPHLIREMMFGFRDAFTYFECARCGCLQIAEMPSNMDKYYPRDYLRSLGTRPSEGSIERFARIRADGYALFGTSFLGRLLYRRARDPNNVLGMLARAKPERSSRILDVGCGSGEFLYRLRDLGVAEVVGVDPYASKEVRVGGLSILRQAVHDIPDGEQFDLVFFHHSLEHIPDQLETVAKVRRLLAPGGVCVIRMPVKTEYIWGLYNVDWVQIDAPRHLFIHTTKSFQVLANHARLGMNNVVFDSAEFQFWGSEQYRRDIPLLAKNSYAVNPGASIFTPEQIKGFAKRAEELNKSGQGDQATFYLTANSAQW